MAENQPQLKVYIPEKNEYTVDEIKKAVIGMTDFMDYLDTGDMVLPVHMQDEEIKLYSVGLLNNFFRLLDNKTLEEIGGTIQEGLQTQ